MKNNNKYYNDVRFPIEGIPSNAVSIVESVASEECALSSLIKVQAGLLCKVSDPCITVCDFIDIVRSIIQTMKTTVLKNNILEVKLRETLNYIQKEGIGCLDYNHQYELLNNLNSVLESIGSEEFSLGYLIDELGESVANINSYCNFDDIKQVNNLVISLMRIIVEINTIFLRKLRTVIKIIEFIKCSDFDIFIKVKKELLCTIENCLINSIFTEEKGLAKLICGETIKIKEALKMCLNEEELSDLDCLINSVIDLISDKKRILKYKLDETLTLLNTVGFSSCEIDSVMDHVKQLQSAVFEGERELVNLIKNNSNNNHGYSKLDDFNHDDLKYNDLNYNDSNYNDSNKIIKNINKKNINETLVDLIEWLDFII